MLVEIYPNWVETSCIKTSVDVGDKGMRPSLARRHVHFPKTSIVSLLYVMEDGSSAEIAVVGNEGIIGIALFMRGETTSSRATCRVPATLIAWQAGI